MNVKTAKNSVIILDSATGEYVIIMLKGKNAVTKRVSELTQSMKFDKIRLLYRICMAETSIIGRELTLLYVKLLKNKSFTYIMC